MKKVRRRLTLFAVALAVLPALAFSIATVEESESREHLRKYLVNVDVSDRIDANEAEAIATAYFLGFVSACGGPDRPKLVDGDWVVPVVVGYAGNLSPSPIRINAKSGAVSYSEGPSFSGYSAFRAVLLWGIPITKHMQFNQ